MTSTFVDICGNDNQADGHAVKELNKNDNGINAALEELHFEGDGPGTTEDAPDFKLGTQ